MCGNNGNNCEGCEGCDQDDSPKGNKKAKVSEEAILLALTGVPVEAFYLADEDSKPGDLLRGLLASHGTPSSDRPAGVEKIILDELSLVDADYPKALRVAQVEAFKEIYLLRASLSKRDLNALYLETVEELTKDLAAPDASRQAFGPKQMELAVKMVNERQKNLEYFFICDDEKKKVMTLGVRLKGESFLAPELDP